MTNSENPPQTANPQAIDLAPPDGLPSGTELQRVTFASAVRDDATVVMEFTAPTRTKAVLNAPIGAIAGGEDAPPLALLMVPSVDFEHPELLTTVREWVDAGVVSDLDRCVMITLHGAQIFWRAGRAAIVAPAERLAAARVAVVEFSFHDGELRGLEGRLARRWPELEGDVPLAFDFDQRASQRRDELAQRFQKAVALRGSLARLLPLVHRPPVHPPTLASQVSERLRERTRLAERVEFCDRQVEVFERVYDQCAQRSSEFKLARRGHLIEWIIMALLAVQTFHILIERLAR